jgi:hypothetical protein
VPASPGAHQRIIRSPVCQPIEPLVSLLVWAADSPTSCCWQTVRYSFPARRPRRAPATAPPCRISWETRPPTQRTYVPARRSVVRVMGSPGARIVTRRCSSESATASLIRRTRASTRTMESATKVRGPTCPWSPVDCVIRPLRTLANRRTCVCACVRVASAILLEWHRHHRLHRTRRPHCAVLHIHERWAM